MGSGAVAGDLCGGTGVTASPDQPGTHPGSQYAVPGDLQNEAPTDAPAQDRADRRTSDNKRQIAERCRGVE